MANVGPMPGHATVFHRYAPERIPCAIERYQRESRRLLELLNGQIVNQEHLAGEYRIAEFANT
jgi:GSH-dependent disulfide-bond oxidoreductase